MYALISTAVARFSIKRNAMSALVLSIAMMTAGAGTAVAGCGKEALPMRIIHLDPSTSSHVKGVLDSESLLREKEVVLTFDDGPLPATSRRILSTLDEFCAKATFFLVGRMARAFPGVVADMARRGHTIGFHTYSHANLKQRSIGSSKSEITRNVSTLNGILSKTGHVRAMAPLFRFPYLKESTAVKDYLSEKGFLTVGTDIDSNDWRHSDGVSIVNSVLGQLKYRKRGIILLHDIKRTTARVLPRLLGHLKRRGYRLVHLRPTSAGIASVAALNGTDTISTAKAESLPVRTAPARAAARLQKRGKISLAVRPAKSSLQRRDRVRAAEGGAIASHQKPKTKLKQKSSIRQVVDGTEYNFSNGASTLPPAAKPVKKAVAVVTATRGSTTTFNFNQSGNAPVKKSRVTKKKTLQVVPTQVRANTTVTGQNINGKSYNFVSVAPASN